MFSSTPTFDFILRLFTLTLLLGAAALPAQTGKLEPTPAAAEAGKDDPGKGDPSSPKGSGGDGGGDEPYRDPVDATSCTFGVNPIPLAAMVELAASGSDATVTIAWSNDPILPATATLVLQDENGNTLMTQSVATVPGGKTSHTLSMALAGVPVHGPQLRVVLEDPFTVPLAPELDFRVTVDCSSGTCAYRILDGLRADSVAISEQLMLAIDGEESSGSSDILADVVSNEPTLESEVLNLAWQLDRLDDTHDLSSLPCTCLWVPAVGLSPDEGNTAYFTGDGGFNYDSRPSSPSHGIAGWDGPGAAFEIAYQSTGTIVPVGDPVPVANQGHSRTIMDLRCWGFSQWSPAILDFGWTTVSIQVPKITGCARTCTAKLNHQTEAWGAMEVEAWGTFGQEANADAEFTANWSIDATELFDAGGNVSADALPEGASTDLTCTHKAGDQTVDGLQTLFGWRSTSTLTTSSVDLHAEARASATQTGDQGWAFAHAYLHYWLESTGNSACAVEPVQEISLDDDQELPADAFMGGGGVLIERWGP